MILERHRSKALEWLMADVFSRRHQLDKVTMALKNLQAQASQTRGASEAKR
jgi:hypothetical protein